MGSGDDVPTGGETETAGQHGKSRKGSGSVSDTPPVGTHSADRAWAMTLSETLACAVESMEILLAHCPVEAPIERENYLFAKETLEEYQASRSSAVRDDPNNPEWNAPHLNDRGQDY